MDDWLCIDFCNSGKDSVLQLLQASGVSLMSFDKDAFTSEIGLVGKHQPAPPKKTSFWFFYGLSYRFNTFVFAPKPPGAGKTFQTRQKQLQNYGAKDMVQKKAVIVVFAPSA